MKHDKSVMLPRVAADSIGGAAAVAHQPRVPGPPLNGPTISSVIHPP
jgi:hypothetical protein